MGEGHTGEPQANQERLTVAQAAAALGITEGAVRSRIKRGTLPTTKERGKLFVLFGAGTSEANQPPITGVPVAQSELIASLQDQVRYLREQLDAEREARTEERRRHDTVVAQFTSKIPAIEAPQEASEAGETVEEEPEFQEPPKSPQTVEEEPERAEPHPASGEAQEGTAHPQQQSGWLAPVDKLPWWQYVLGVLLVCLAVYIATAVEGLLPRWPYVTVYVSPLIAAAWVLPGVFGLWVGLRKRNLRLWAHIIPFGALIAVVRSIAVMVSYTIQGFMFILPEPGALVAFATRLSLPAWLLYVAGAFLGNAWQRRRTRRISGITPASPVSRTMQGAGQQPRKDLTPTQQAMLGWGGAIISALISLVGTLITVRSGG